MVQEHQWGISAIDDYEDDNNADGRGGDEYCCIGSGKPSFKYLHSKVPW